MHSKFSSLAFKPVRIRKIQTILSYLYFLWRQRDLDVVVIKRLSSNNCSDSPSKISFIIILVLGHLHLPENDKRMFA